MSESNCENESPDLTFDALAEKFDRLEFMGINLGTMISDSKAD